MQILVIFNIIFTFQKWYFTSGETGSGSPCLRSPSASGVSVLPRSRWPRSNTYLSFDAHHCARRAHDNAVNVWHYSILSLKRDAVTSSPRSAGTIYHHWKGNSWNSWQVLPAQHTAFHLMCHGVSVCLPSTRRAKDFKISQRQMVERGKSWGKQEHLWNGCPVPYSQRKILLEIIHESHSEKRWYPSSCFWSCVM